MCITTCTATRYMAILFLTMVSQSGSSMKFSSLLMPTRQANLTGQTKQAINILSYFHISVSNISNVLTSLWLLSLSLSRSLYLFLCYLSNTHIQYTHKSSESDLFPSPEATPLQNLARSSWQASYNGLSALTSLGKRVMFF